MKPYLRQFATLCVLGLMASCATELKTISDTTPNYDWLFVQSGTTTTLEKPDGDADRYTLTMNGVTKLIGFTDRPYHLVKVMTMPKWLELWSPTDSDSYKISPPNTAVSFTLTPEQQGGSGSDIGFMLVTLTEPTITEDANGTHTVKYRLTNVDTSFLPPAALEGTPDGGIALQNASLVIDGHHHGGGHKKKPTASHTIASAGRTTSKGVHTATKATVNTGKAGVAGAEKEGVAAEAASKAFALQQQCNICTAGMAAAAEAVSEAVEALYAETVLPGSSTGLPLVFVTAIENGTWEGISSAAWDQFCGVIGTKLAPTVRKIYNNKTGSEEKTAACLTEICGLNVEVLAASLGESFAPLVGWSMGEIACGCQNITKACDNTSHKQK